jgi:hypothetical protein
MKPPFVADQQTDGSLRAIDPRGMRT